MSNSTSLGGIARAKHLSPQRRSHIARQAANARWQRRTKGILSIDQIADMVREAIIVHRGSIHGISAFLFGSYSRGEARPQSDLDILIVVQNPSPDMFRDTWAIREHMTDQKSIDLIVVDEEEFSLGKIIPGTVLYDVAQEGVRLV